MKRIWLGIISLLVVLPVLFLVGHGVGASFKLGFSSIWGPVSRSIALASVVTGLSSVIGVGLGWIIARYDFPGRRFFRVGLMLPLAAPAYIFAFIWVGVLDFHLAVRHFWGASMILSLALYPYVYWLALSGFSSLPAAYYELAQTLGVSRPAIFSRVLLPLSRQWLLAAAMIVFLEVLADFGAVYILNVDTLTTAIYQTWFARFSFEGALVMALPLVGIALIWGLGLSRVRSHQVAGLSRHARLPRQKLGRYQWVVTGGLSIFGAIIWGVPLGQLGLWMVQQPENWDSRFLIGLQGSVILGGVGATLLVGGTWLMVWAVWRSRGQIRLGWLTQFGYAIPGTVMAVALYQILQLLGPASVMFQGYLGSLLLMLWGYSVRFLASGYRPLYAAVSNLSADLVSQAQLLGAGRFRRIRAVYWPLLRSGLVAAWVLCFVEILKEMPMTVMLRPIGWQGLSVQIFEFTSEGDWARAAWPAGCIIGVGLLSVFLMMQVDRSDMRDR